jgi:hypothetical protein
MAYPLEQKKRMLIAELTIQLAKLGLTLQKQYTKGDESVGRRVRYATKMMSLMEFAAILLDHPGQTREELIIHLYQPDELWTPAHQTNAERRFYQSWRRLQMALPNIITIKYARYAAPTYHPYPTPEAASKRLLASGLSPGHGITGRTPAPPM